jgi:gamma-glutamyltranspeptidase / glutathione hydrolase
LKQDSQGLQSRRAFSTTAVIMTLMLGGCGTLFGPSAPTEGQPTHIAGFIGAVVADEPQAALIGRDVLSTGGDAADAATAVGMALAVTLPSRAGLGGGGACLAYAAGHDSINHGEPEAIIFVPQPSTAEGGDRPAALPILARGLYLLHARYGTGDFGPLVVPAERLARLGTQASRSLVEDLQLVSGPLFADPQTRAIFSANGTPLTVGQTFQQPALAATLATIRTAGVGDFYQGGMAQQIAQNSPLAGGPISVADLRRALPSLATPITVPFRDDQVSFLPPPADGGLAAASAFLTLIHNPQATDEAAARALAVAARWRVAGGNPQSLLTAALPPGELPPLPASTTFLTLDRHGGAVACTLTLDNLFGTGRMVPTLGFFLAASPSTSPLPLLSASVAWNRPLRVFRAETAASGQQAAALGAALTMFNTLRTSRSLPVLPPDPSRANVIACPGYLPGSNASCTWATDPRGYGLAASGS